MASVTLADGTKIPLTGNDSEGYQAAAGEGILCMQCHQARVAANTYVPSTAGSSHFGPHEGPQADMLAGTNGFTYGQAMPTSAHQYVVPNTCVTCHMQTVATTDPGFEMVGEHTFKPSYTPAGGKKESLVAACQTCHGPDVTTFDFPLFDYNGDGKIDGVQTEVQSLLDQLSTMLPPNNSVKTRAHHRLHLDQAAAGSGLQLAVRQQRRQQGHPQYCLRGGPAEGLHRQPGSG